MTAVLEDADTELSDTTDPGKFAHYTRKDKIVDAYVFGNAVVALCGYVFVPSGDPERRQVCPPCREIFEGKAP